VIKTARILVLEDDAPLREKLASVLQDEGFDVMAAARGEEAVAISSRKLFDLVVLDVHSGNLSSYRTLSRVHHYLKEAAVLAITKTVSEEDSIRSLRFSAADYLRKPFEVNIFLERIGRLLKLTRQHQQQREESLCLQTLHSWSIQTLLSSFLEGRFSDHTVRTAQQAGLLAKSLAQQANLESPIVQEIEIGAVLQTLSAQKHWHNSAKSLELWEDSFLKNYSKPEYSLARYIIDSALSASLQPHTLSPHLREDLAGLSLASTFFHCGYWQEAEKILQHLSTQPTLSGIKAQLRLAALCLHNSQNQPALTYLQSAMQTAELLGPPVWARTALEAYLLYVKVDDRHFLSELQKAQAILAQLQLEPHCSRSILASSGCLPVKAEQISQALGNLLKAKHELQMETDLPWLLPLLLNFLYRHCQLPCPLENKLVKLLRWQSTQITEILSKQTFTPKHVAQLKQFAIRWKRQLSYALLERLNISQNSTCAQSQARTTTFNPTLELKLLGQCSIKLNGETVNAKLWTTQKAKHLFLRLLSHGTYLSCEQIIEEFWPESSNGQACLWKALSTIKKIFKDKCPDFDPIARCSSALSPNPRLKIVADWQSLEKLWGTYRVSKNIRLLKDIKQLSQGHFLPQCSMEWATLKRVRLDYISLQALTELASYQYKQKDWMELVETASQAISLEPLHEQCTYLLMQAYIAIQQPQLASQTFENLQKAFKAQLNQTPNPRLGEIYQKIRQT